MRRHLVTLLLLAIAPLPARGASEKPLPMGKIELLCLYSSEVYDKRVTRAIDGRGINFIPDEEYLQILVDAGATEEFIKTLRGARISKSPVPGGEPLASATTRESEIVRYIARALQIKFNKLRPAGAELELRAALALDPKNPWIHVLLGGLLSRLAQREEALAEYGEAVRLDPELVGARIELAGALMGQGRLEEAERECREVIRLDPQSARGHSLLETILERKGDKDGVRAEKQLAEKLKVDDGPPKRIRVGGQVASAKLIFQPEPIYPPEAQKHGIQGVVRLEILIGRDGAVKDMQVLSGDPMLTGPARAGVSQWRYQPTTIKGIPVEVITAVDVNFRLR